MSSKSSVSQKRKKILEESSVGILEGKVYPLPSKEKQYTKHSLVAFAPKTQPQSEFFQAYESQIPLILQVGSAGTGKTVCALYCALRDVFDPDTPYDNVMIIRSAVQAREIGFLKGDEEEKNAAYESPYIALCDQLLVYKTRNYEFLKKRGLINFETTSFLRGQTFDRTIVIVDEFQSMTYHELSTIITRVGLYSKIVFCGDFKQSDLHRKGDDSGFFKFMKTISLMPEQMSKVITYLPEDNVRSGISREFLLAEEKL